MSEPIDEDVEEKSKAGREAGREKPCPICGDLVPTPTVPKHIREEHSGTSEFPDRYDQIPDDRRCPSCDSGPLEPGSKPNRWVCVDCGRMFDGDAPDSLVEVKSNLEDD